MDATAGYAAAPRWQKAVDAAVRKALRDAMRVLMSQILPTYLVDQHGVPIDGRIPAYFGRRWWRRIKIKSNGDATDGWSMRLTDGAAFIVPAKTGQLPAAPQRDDCGWLGVGRSCD